MLKHESVVHMKVYNEAYNIKHRDTAYQRST